MREVRVSENVFSDIRMPVMVLRLFGMLPVTNVNKNSGYILKYSRKITILYYVIALLIGGWTGFGIYNDVKQFRREGLGLRIQGELDVYINAFDVSMVSLTVVLVVLSTPFKMKYFMNALLSMNEIDNIIKQHVRNTGWNRSICIVKFIMAHLLVQAVLIFDGIYQQDFKTYSLVLFVERYGNLFFTCPAILTQQMAYWSLVHSVRKRLRDMNNILEKATKNERRNFRRIFTHIEKKVQTNDFMRNLNICSEEQHDEFNEDTTGTTDIIRLMMIVHENIYKCVLFINRFFDYPVLFILINCTMELIINPWILLSRMKFNEVFSCWLPLVWISIHVVQLFLLIEPIHAVLSEHQKTKLLIVQLLNIVKDSRAVEKVEHFALQHQMCSLKFTAVDMVTLGRSLYTRVASAVTTYLVILLQIKN